MKTIAIIIAVVLSPLLWPIEAVEAATWNSDGSPNNVQLIHDTQAADGDTITIPAGTFNWTTGVTLTKAITLAGLGTVTKDVNNRATICGTKIKASVAGSVITWKLVANKTSRMTGLEFIAGSAYGGSGTVSVEGLNTDSRRMIIDQCVFNQLKNWALALDTVLGVVHHCTFYCSYAGWYTVDATNWNTTPGMNTSHGNGSWAESENYGSERFTFFEDNTFVGEYGRSSTANVIRSSGNVTFTVPAGLAISNGQPLTAIFWDTATGKSDPNFAMYGTVFSYSGTTLVMTSTQATGVGATKAYWTIAYRNAGSDGQRGSRQVVRHNIFSNGGWQNHGLEASYTRGGRVVEFYNNEMYGNTSSAGAMLFRSGTGLIYNNTLTNFQTSTPIINLVNYSSRQDAAVPWGGPDGRNPWHDNAAAAIVTGTVTSADTTTYTMRDNTKTWTPNKYQNYTIRATSGVSVSSMTRSGSTVNITTSAAHGLTTGNKISIMGADQHWYNKLYSSCTVTDSTHFTITLDATPTSPATGTIRVRKEGFYALIRSSATDGTVTWSEGANGADYTLQLKVGDTYEINQVNTVMDQCGMGAGTLLTLPLIENPPIGWPNQVVSPLYQWNNGAALFDNRIDFSGATYATIAENVHYFAQATSFDGTSGMGRGTTAQRMAITPTRMNVGFWDTDQNKLYVWNGAAWMSKYTAYTYPHPLTASNLSYPNRPTNLRVIP